jgi:hypothetical protein
MGTSTVDRKQIREQSLASARRLGYEVNEGLPLLDDELRLRSQESAVERFLCLHAAAACAYGFDRLKAKAWVDRESVYSSLTDDERRFIEHGEGDAGPFRTRIEAMWALAWALGIAGAIDFGKGCPDSLATMLPDLREGESSAAFRRRASFRSVLEISSAADLAYCLHWAIRQAELDRQPLIGKVEPYVIIERRHALDWLLSEDPWDEVSLDT